MEEEKWVLKRPEQQPDQDKWGTIEKSNLLAPRSSASILAIRTPLSPHCSQPNAMLISLLKRVPVSSLSVVVQPKSKKKKKKKFLGGMEGNGEKIT